MSWEELTDNQGNLYYYNSSTEQTQWEKPSELISGLDKALAERGWTKAYTEEHEAYYYHEQTGESVWELPADVKSLLDGSSGAGTNGVDPNYSTRDSSKTPGVAGENEDENNNNEDEEDEVIEFDDGQIQGENKYVVTDDSESRPGNSLIGLNSIIQENEKIIKEIQTGVQLDTTGEDQPEEYYDYKTYIPGQEIKKGEELKADEQSSTQFMEMLASKSVDSTWSFNQIMETFVKDERYWGIKDSLLRKSLFEIYLIQKADKEFREVENSKESYKVSFFQVLDNYDIKWYTTWKTCSNLIIDEPMYSLINNKLKKEFFKEYVRNLKTEHETALRESRKEELKNLEGVMKELVVDLSAKFDDILNSLDMTLFTHLNKLDVLTIYESIVHGLETEFEKTVKEQIKLNNRSDRKARDEFKKLLEELKDNKDGKGLEITADLKWFELLPYIVNDERFVNLCGRKGSSAIDFFWDLLDKENQTLRAKKDLVKQLLTNDNFEMKKQSKGDEEKEGEQKAETFVTFDEFLAKLKSLQHNQVEDEIKETDYRLIYELLIKEQKEQPTESRPTKRKLESSGLGASNGEGGNKKRLTTLGYGAL